MLTYDPAASGASVLSIIYGYTPDSMSFSDPYRLSNWPSQCWRVEESPQCLWAISFYLKDDGGAEPVGGSDLPDSPT